jgi:two-component system repressor protein LuxO
MAFGRHRSEPIDVLIVDADPGQRRALAGLIAERALGRFMPQGCANRAEALAAARNGSGAIMIADIETIGGTANLAEFMSPSTTLIATSASGSLNAAVAALRAGATDFLPKPIGAKALFDRLEAALAGWPSARETPSPSATDRPAAQTDFAGFIGSSPSMRAIYEQIRRVALSRAPVFITGETGTGKEVCADAIHGSAGAPGRPFVAINCSAIPRDLMESEIFGHARGAFTGAADNRRGAAEIADGGTLFLDEIAEMDQGLQAKLLRFVQTGTFRRVGDSELKRVDLRLVCATNRDPFAEVEAGRFRADLFYRLHVLPIHVPPLRDHPDDITALAEAFLARYAAEEDRAFRHFDKAAAERLSAYSWPGNVRQLQNLVRQIVVLHDGVTVTPAMLPSSLAEPASGRKLMAPAGVTHRSSTVEPFWVQERHIIETALAAFEGNVARAAAALDLSPSTIYRKRQAWSERLSG